MRLPEHDYLDLLSYVIERGDRRVDRTGVGTLSVLGAMLRFDLSKGQVPLLTTKRVFWKTAVKEMLWFLTGSTNIQPLLKENVRIWTDWPLTKYRQATGEKISQEEFEQRIVMDDVFASKWGELGPIYGKQWRRWVGADGCQYDQIAEVLHTLKTDPSSRRILFHAWNVPELKQMTLPPCHMVYQFHCTSDGELGCLMFQRSCDLFLGAPFNYLEVAALQLMLAQQAGLTPGEMIWIGGDVHLYVNHIEQAKEQIRREPRPFPKMRLLRKPGSIDGYQIDDFELEGYDPHPAIGADVAV